MNDDNWTQERIDLIKKEVCPKGISNDEFSVFLAQCKRTGLDPLIKEAFCTPRKENIGSRDNPKWITRHTFVPGHDGMLARADRFDDFRGIRGAAVYSKDVFCIKEAETTTVVHEWNPIADRGELIGAWSVALRAGRQYPIEWILFEEYRDDRSALWREKPQTMLVKCARVAALRRAYPNAFGAIYIKEEMTKHEPDEAPAHVSKIEQAKAVAPFISAREVQKVLAAPSVTSTLVAPGVVALSGSVSAAPGVVAVLPPEQLPADYYAPAPMDDSEKADALLMEKMEAAQTEDELKAIAPQVTERGTNKVALRKRYAERRAVIRKAGAK